MVEQNLVGKKLGDYILLKKLTSGGMAHIYLGEDEKLQRRAAIKVLTADMAGDDDILRERFEREARAIAQLEHDSIVPIYQFGEEGNLYFIAMRYIEGNDLADEMRKYKKRDETMPPARMLSILKQVAGALDHAHKRGIIHRDVKPSNILLRRQEGDVSGDKAVLTDFGLVLWEDVDKTLGTAFGTPRYISPEQATDSQTALPQSDVYSLAVIVYEILTGEVLFKGATPMEVALSHITEPPTPPRAHNPEIPQDAQIEILKALQKDAAKRHRTAMSFIDAMRRAYNLEDTQPIPLDKVAEDSRTKPLRDARSTDTDSTKDVMDSWDKIPSPVEKQGKERPPSIQAVVSPRPSRRESEQESGGLPVPAIAGVVVAIAIGIAAAMGLFNLGKGGANVVNGSGNANMEIHYNENFFAIINISENTTLDISGIRINGADGTSETNFGDLLAPAECVFVRRNAVSNTDIPSDWNCSGDATTVTASTTIFWRAENADDDMFTVLNDGNVVTTCNTAGRAVNRAGDNTCEIEWLDYLDE